MTRREDGTIWITGGSQGLGRALALHAASATDRPIAVSARGEDALRAIEAESNGRIRGYALDATDRAATAETIKRIEAELGPIGLAVLNAGTHSETPAAEMKAEDFARIMDLNYMGVVHGLEALIPVMRGRGRGHIAVTASIAGYRGLPRAGAYCASKAAVIALCESLKFELDGMGIRLQLCCPGFVRTPLTDKNPFPMPHLMEPEDAAREYWRGLQGDDFEITFPKVFTRQLKALRLLPYGLYFKAVGRATGVRS